jgi:serine/threonine protein kinase
MVEGIGRALPQKVSMTLRSQLVNLKDYDVDTKPVGKGAFGVVHRGVRRGDGEVVAIKFLQPLPELNQRTFVREVTVPSLLRHPAVLPFIGFRLPEKATDGPIIVTKFITNGSLGDI